MDDDRRLVALDEVPTDGTLLLTLRREGAGESEAETDEAILLRLADDVVAYRNYCQHWTDVRLDKGSGALVRNGEVVCQKHAATFESDSGYCNFGPCEGSYLDRIDVVVEDGVVYLDDDAYEFERLGPSGETEQSTGSRIDFTGT